MNQVKKRDGKECRKINCIHYVGKDMWNKWFKSAEFCMECKWCFKSQYKKVIKEGDI